MLSRATCEARAVIAYLRAGQIASYRSQVEARDTYDAYLVTSLPASATTVDDLILGGAGEATSGVALPVLRESGTITAYLIETSILPQINIRIRSKDYEPHTKT